MPDIFVLKKDFPKVHGHRVEIGIFSSFWQHPNHHSMLDKEEAVLLVLRRHFVTNISWILITVFLLIFPILLFLISLFSKTPIFDLPVRFSLVLTILYYLVIFGYSFVKFLDWYFNIMFLTQKRIIDIDFGGLIFHDVAETQFPYVQDVNYTQVGFLGSLFNFGDVHAQTAGDRENFEALGVPEPERVTQVIASFMGRTES